jgi:hypothetical protein
MAVARLGNPEQPRSNSAASRPTPGEHATITPILKPSTVSPDVGLIPGTAADASEEGLARFGATSAEIVGEVAAVIELPDAAHPAKRTTPNSIGNNILRGFAPGLSAASVTSAV